MNTAFKAALFLTAVCADSVMAAPVTPEGLVGVTQEIRIDRSLAPQSDLPQTCAMTIRTEGQLRELPAPSGLNSVRLLTQSGRGAA